VGHPTPELHQKKTQKTPRREIELAEADSLIFSLAKEANDMAPETKRDYTELGKQSYQRWRDELRAERLGVSQAQVARLEKRGYDAYTLSSLRRYVQALGEGFSLEVSVRTPAHAQAAGPAPATP
jgi:hypothetical protein